MALPFRAMDILVTPLPGSIHMRPCICILELGNFKTDEQIRTAVTWTCPKVEGLYTRAGQHVLVNYYDCAENKFRFGHQNERV